MIKWEKSESELKKMLSEQMRETLKNSSAIRKMFIEGQELAEKVGAGTVFVFLWAIRLPLCPRPLRMP